MELTALWHCFNNYDLAQKIMPCLQPVHWYGTCCFLVRCMMLRPNVCWLVYASTQCLFLLFPIDNSRSGETNKTADIIWDSYSHDLAEKLNLKWIHVCLSENEKFT